MSKDSKTKHNLSDYCLGVMLACVIHEDIYKHMRTLYDFVVEIEDEVPGGMKTDDLRLEIVNDIRKSFDSLDQMVPEEFDFDDLTKCAISALWCRRVLTYIDHIHDEFVKSATMDTDLQEGNS